MRGPDWIDKLLLGALMAGFVVVIVAISAVVLGAYAALAYTVFRALV